MNARPPLELNVRCMLPSGADGEGMRVRWWVEGGEYDSHDRTVCVRWSYGVVRSGFPVHKLPCAVVVYGHDRPSTAFLSLEMSPERRPVLEYEGVRWDSDSEAPAWLCLPADRSLSLRFRVA